MDTWLIYVRSKTSERDKEAVHIWKEEIQRQKFEKTQHRLNPKNYMECKTQFYLRVVNMETSGKY